MKHWNRQFMKFISSWKFPDCSTLEIAGAFASSLPWQGMRLTCPQHPSRRTHWWNAWNTSSRNDRQTGLFSGPAEANFFSWSLLFKVRWDPLHQMYVIPFASFWAPLQWPLKETFAFMVVVLWSAGSKFTVKSTLPFFFLKKLNSPLDRLEE